MRLPFFLLGVLLMNLTGAQPFNFTTYREANGLPSGYIETAFEDSRGYLWLGTTGGLSRFDGKNFVNYGIRDGLPSNIIDGITEDGKGRLWLTTRAGVSLFNGKTFTNYPYAEASGSATYYHYLQKEPDGHIHTSVRNHLYKIADDKVQEESAPPGFKDSVINYHLLSSGTAVITTKKTLYVLRPGGGRTCYNGLTTSILRIIFPKEDPNSFYVAGSTGVYHWKEGRLQKKSGLSFEKQILTAFFMDNKSRIWVAAESKGIKIINTLTNKVDSVNSLPILVTHVFQDRQGTLWISTFRGLVKVSESFARHYTEGTGLIAEDIRSSGTLTDGSLFMGANLIQDGKIADYPTAVKKEMQQDRSFGDVTAMAMDGKRSIWMFIYTSKIFSYANGKLSEETPKTRKLFVSAALYDPADSTILIATDNCLLFMKDGRISDSIDRQGNGKPFTDIRSVKRDYFGNIWINDNGRTLLKKGKLITDFTEQLGLPSAVAAQMCYSDSSGCWFGTAGYGIIHFRRAADGSLIKDRLLDKAHGLMNDNILSLTVDEHKYMWIASNSGLCYVNLEKVKNGGNFVVHPLTAEEGFDVPNWNLAYLEKDGGGNVWLGVGNGIYQFNTRNMAISSPAPFIQMDNVVPANDEAGWQNSYPSENNYFSLPQPVSFGFNQNRISFSFNGINLKTGFVKYSYILENQDNAWITGQSNNSVTYSNLSPGRYCFKVKAVNDYGIESSKAAEFNFVIRPPFWQTWWFRIVMILLSIVLIYLFVKRREKITESKNNRRLRMSELRLQAVQSQMNPHFIFNSLNSIQNFIVQNNQIEAARYLSRFSKLIRRILDNSHHQFLKVEDIIETLQMYVELEAFRFNKEFTYSFEVDTTDARMYDAELPPMLLQPFVENAILHGLMPKEGEKHLKVCLFIKDDCLNCIIEDNGAGRKEKADTGHISRGEKLTQGMLDSMRHLQNTEASIRIKDLKDEAGAPAGTRVTIRIPVTKN